MKIGIATAMASERSQIERLLEERESVVANGRRFCTCRIGRNEVVLGETGIGKVNAAIGAVAMIHGFHPDCLLSTGVAGGLDASLRVMDAVAASEVVYHDVDCGPDNEYGQVQGCPARFPADARLLAYARSLAVEGTTLATGLMASGDCFVARPEQIDAIRAHFPTALAVDMESGALAQTCHILGVPFLSLRILSDAPNGDSDRFSQYTDFWDRIAGSAFALSRLFLVSLPAALADIPLPSAPDGKA